MPLTHAILKAKQRELRAGFPETMGLRVHRSISWIGRAEQATDDDGRFIFLWIAFNAAYADEEEFQNAAPGERAAFATYFRKVVALDAGQRVYDAIWNNFSGPIRVLLDNRFRVQPLLAAPQRNRRIRGLGGMVQGLAAAIRASLADTGHRRGAEPRVRPALRPSQPARPRRRDLEQSGSIGIRFVTAPPSWPFSCPCSSTS